MFIVANSTGDSGDEKKTAFLMEARSIPWQLDENETCQDIIFLRSFIRIIIDQIQSDTLYQSNKLNCIEIQLKYIMYVDFIFLVISSLNFI